MTKKAKAHVEPEMIKMICMLADTDIKSNGEVTDGTKELFELYNLEIPLKYIKYL